MKKYENEPEFVRSLLKKAEEQYDGIEGFALVRRLPGGERNDVFALEDRRGKKLILRILHHDFDLRGLEYINRWSAYCADHVPVINTPLCTKDGRSSAGIGPFTVCFLPFVEGGHADRNDAVIRDEMARYHAQIHRVSLSYPDRKPRPDRAPLGFLDLDENFMFNWEQVRKMLENGGRSMFDDPRYQTEEMQKYIEGIYDRRGMILGEKDYFQRMFADLRKKYDSYAAGPIHGDMYGANVLAQDGHIRGIIDWDESNFELHVYELARTMWEFSKDGEGTSILSERATRYLSVYLDSEGTSKEGEWRYLIPLIRAVKFLDIIFYMQNSMIGDVWSPAYGYESAVTLENLADFALFE